MTDLFLTVLRLSIHAALIAVVVMGLRLVLQKAPKAMTVALWGLVALRLICPFILEFQFSAVPKEISSGRLIEKWSETPAGDYETVYEGQATYSKAVDAGIIPQVTPEGKRYVITAPDKISPPETVETTVLPVLAWIWVSGMMCMILYSAVSYGLLCRSVSQAVRQKDNIYTGSCVISPFLMGLAKPKIYLPVNIPEGDAGFVVAHERTHIAGKDHWWKPLGFLLLSVHWFNPLLWLSYSLLCKDIELACDEKVAKTLTREQRADYSQALLNCSVHKNKLLYCPLAFGEMSVKERVKQVLRYKKPKAVISVAAVVLIISCGVFFLTGSVSKEIPELQPPTVTESPETTAPPTTEAATQPTATQPTTELSLPRQNISGSYWIDGITLFVHTENLLDFLLTLPDGGGAWTKCIQENELTIGTLYELNEVTGDVRVIAEGPVREYLQTREDYFYILQEAPNMIMQKDKKSGTETPLHISQQGSIADIGYYGYEDNGDLVFIVDKSYVYTIKMPEKEVILLYEKADNIDAIVVFSRERGMIEFRDINWKFWDYFFETGEMKGPFD